MDFNKKYFNNARKPEGELGSQMLDVMNSGTHTALSEWSLPYLHTEKGFTALDIGCGGGANLKRLLGRCDKVYGIDYSPLSVKKSTEFNRAEIESGRCFVGLGDVTELPFEDCFFDVATAFETVYFWQDIGKAFSEIYRVLKKGGVLLITNESNGVDESAVKMSAIIDGMNLYTPEALADYLRQAGFNDIKINRHGTEAWINVLAVK